LTSPRANWSSSSVAAAALPFLGLAAFFDAEPADFFLLEPPACLVLGGALAARVAFGVKVLPLLFFFFSVNCRCCHPSVHSCYRDNARYILTWVSFYQDVFVCCEPKISVLHMPAW
jgi:hypothetical protein